ncbi:Glycine betaine/carnitine/choline transport system permease protein OpuCB [subsurface metagenome]
MRRYIILVSVLTLLIGLSVWITSLEWIKEGVYKPFSWSDVLNCTWSHLWMVLIAESIAIAIGVPLAILVTRPRFAIRLPFGILVNLPDFRKLAPVVVGGANVGQTIPSLALIAIMAPILGFGLNSALVAIVIWGLLPIVRNSYAAINNIDPAIVEAARGMGMTRGQIARKIELPLALPIIMVGIRISTVITVGTTELAVLVGGAGLGRITLTGVFSMQPLTILQGTALTSAMAIALGFILEYIGRRMTARGLRVKAQMS